MISVIKRHLWLAEVASAGPPTDIHIEIDSPRPTGSGEEAACLVLLRGLMPDAIDVYGSDSFSAMQCAMAFAEAELRALPATSMIQWPGGESYFDEPTRFADGVRRVKTMNRDQAVQIRGKALAAIEELASVLEIIEDKLPAEEFGQVKMGVGLAIGSIEMHVNALLYRQHPDLDL